MNKQSPITIIGAGPIGLAAAHLFEKDEHPIVFEAGREVGFSIKLWDHIKLFSPWGFNIDQASKMLLTESGWKKQIKTSYLPARNCVKTT